MATAEVATARPASSRTLGRRLARTFQAVWPPAVLLLLVYAVWWVVTDRELVAPYLVPKPAEVYDKMTAEWPNLLSNTWVTLYETLYGFGLAIVLGLGIAALIVYSEAMEKTLYPLVLFAQVIPKIAIAPVLIVWFGTGLTPKVILAVLIAFFPVVISGVAGLRSTDPELLDLSATMGAGPWRTFRKIRFPNALPHLMAGLKVAITLAVVGAVVGEFVGASEGLGYTLLLANGNVDAALLFAALILMSVIGILLFLVVEVAEALILPWHASRRTGVPLTTT
jgi:NitT/TauT family transport system permease protein